MDNSDVHILDLPDEMLLVILNKLNSVDALCSLVGINQRLDQVACDPFYTRHLDCTVRVSFDFVCSMPEPVLDRLCATILPRIHLNVNKITFELLSMERILLAANYPQLHSLTLVNCEQEELLRHLKSMQQSLVKFFQLNTVRVLR
jgi:hypothetical protein